MLPWLGNARTFAHASAHRCANPLNVNGLCPQGTRPDRRTRSSGARKMPRRTRTKIPSRLRDRRGEAILVVGVSREDNPASSGFARVHTIASPTSDYMLCRMEGPLATSAQGVIAPLRVPPRRREFGAAIRHPPSGVSRRGVRTSKVGFKVPIGEEKNRRRARRSALVLPGRPAPNCSCSSHAIPGLRRPRSAS